MTIDTTAQQSATDADQDQMSSDSTLSTADLGSSSAAARTESNSPDTEVETRSTGGTAPLFSDEDAQSFRDQWSSIQASFVDDPQQAVQQADSLVANTIKRLAQVFADERDKLEAQWSSGQDASTEDLRVALQRYRSFFDRLLSV
jgi:hypothetical protein